MHTGSIIDFYDDPNGLVLKTKMSSGQIPGFIKTAQFLGESQREALPDDVYALVMVDQGAKLRKYACVDKGNAALSVIYFLENKDKLPEEAQKVAAANLLTACKWHDLRPPAPLMKLAGFLGTATNALFMKDAITSGAARHKKMTSAIPKMPKIGDLTGSNVMPLSGDIEKGAAISLSGIRRTLSKLRPSKQALPKQALPKQALPKQGLSKKEIAALAAAGGLAAGGTVYYKMGKGGRKRVAKEVRDPRLYSNLRGMATLESRKKRVAEHKGLKKSDGRVLSAMKAGFTREKTAGPKLDKFVGGWKAGGKALKDTAAASKKTGYVATLRPTFANFKDGILGKDPEHMGYALRTAAPSAAKVTGGVGAAGGAYQIGKHMGSKDDTPKTAGILQPDLPRARDVIKGRGPAKRAERSALRDKLRSTHPEGEPYLGDKMASVMRPYVDVTGKSAPERFEKVAHQRFALVKEGQNRFPIDTYGDVLEADRWFNDHGESLHPAERRELCTKLASRADEIGCKVTDYVKKYAGVGYAPDGEVRVAVSTRMQYFQDDSPERDMLNGLMNKYAHVSPDVFCEAVKQFDEATGLDYHWDDGVYDPWYTTYGFVKEAAWEFSTHGDKINEEQLKQVVNASYPLIKEKFGDDMADGLKKSPVSIFSSLPLDTKRIIMRMANDPQPSPALVLS